MPKKPKRKSKHKKIQIWTKYNIKDNQLERMGKFCPRCGPGTFLAIHKDRITCGRCGYSETNKREQKLNG